MPRPRGGERLLTFCSRRSSVLDLYALRQKYLSAELRFTKLTVLGTQVAISESAATFLNGKARRLKLARALLTVAVVLIAIGLELHRPGAAMSRDKRTPALPPEQVPSPEPPPFQPDPDLIASLERGARPDKVKTSRPPRRSSPLALQ